MKRTFLFLSVIIVVSVTGLFLPTPARSGVNVNINIPLPGLVLPAPPGLIVIPGSYVYYPPDVDVDIFFYHGYWYRPYGGRWYIASGYNGPWRGVEPRRVPRPLIDMPGGYRRVPPRYGRMPYREVHNNWRTWENERRWDNDRYERHDREDRWEHGGEHDNGRHGRGRHG